MPAAAHRRVVSRADRERLANAAVQVFEPHPEVLAAYLYGSVARGEPAVDLDIAILLESPLTHRTLEQLAALLQAQGAPQGPQIDLRPLVGAGGRFQVNVLREGEVLFERDRDRRLVHEAQMMSRWADFRPRWEQMRRKMLRRWLDG